MTRQSAGPARPATPTRVKAVRWLLAAAIVLAIGLPLQHRLARQASPSPAGPSASRTAKVRAGDLVQSLRLTGNTVAAKGVLLRAPYLRGRRSVGGARDFGLVLDELAESGTRVSKNQVVAAFDNLPMRLRLDDFRASRLEDEAFIQTTRADLAVRRAAYRHQIRAAKARMDQAALDLKTAPVRSAIQTARFRLELGEATATYKALLEHARLFDQSQQAEIHLAQLAAQQSIVAERRAAANVARLTARAPVAGLVVVTERIRGSELSQIQAGDELGRGQPYAQVVDPSSLIVQATANQADVELLRVGAPATIHFDSFAALKLPARVASIGVLAQGRRWRAAYLSEVPVFLQLERQDPRLIPNLTAAADVVLHREPSQAIIPREAVQYDHNDAPFAYVRTASGWEKRSLDLGIANNIEVAVQSGVQPGEEIALMGQ